MWTKMLSIAKNIHIRKTDDPIFIYKKDNKAVIEFYKLKSGWADITGFKYQAFVFDKDNEKGISVYNASFKDLIWECFEVLNHFDRELDKEIFNFYLKQKDNFINLKEITDVEE